MGTTLILILKIVSGWLIVEVPNWIRRLKKIYYVPIYFSIFPLRELNANLSCYLGEDYFIGYGSSLDEKELKRLKQKIITTSILSMVIAAILIPSFAGFLFAFFMNKTILIYALITIGIYKVFRIILALKDFEKHAIATKKNIGLLILIYFAYLGVFVQMIRQSFFWTIKYVEEDNWLGMMNDLAELIFTKAIAQGLILAALTAIIVTQFTDKEIRKDNLK